ncbi:protein flp-like isoform X2 [Haliotis rubra]|uniref:protein flp-like isoform X2 n=1 Tax=Haliotis rubra TaxID=36100 RepID=UPI001EE50793|nr:protein flp-like isoform X2 [Haliotis rubra]
MFLQSTLLSLCATAALWGVVYTVVDDVAVDAVINAGMGCHQTPGLAVAVVKNGNVVMSRGFGVSNIAAATPVTNTTLFGIASLSKAFTTTLLSKILKDRTRFFINTNVYKILGRYKFNNTLRSVYATVEDLMAHRMGIPRNNYLRLDDTLTRDNLLSRVKYLPSVGGFRDSFYYSDLMYGLLTHITEFLTKKAWEDSMTDIIFKPLHMDSTTFGTRVDYSAPNMATPYSEQSSKLVVPSSQFIRHWAKLGGSGSVVSTADDMAKWMLFHLSGGKNREGNQVVAEDLLKETYKPRNAISGGSINTYFSRPKTPVTMSNNGYGLGWKSGYYRGIPMVQHSGSTFGYRSFLTLLPDKNLGVFVTMTGYDPDYWFRGSLSAYLMDVYLGEAPWINTSTICSFPDPWRTSSTRRRSRPRKGSGRRLTRRRRATSHTANLALQAYSGTFRNEAYGNIIIHYDSASHELKATYGIASWVLASRGGDTFRATWDKPAPILNFNFVFKTSSGHAYALIPSFEHSSPPVFYRTGGSDPIIG